MNPGYCEKVFMPLHKNIATKAIPRVLEFVQIHI